MAAEVVRKSSFKRDYKRERRGAHKEELDALLRVVIELLIDGKPLPASTRDHPLAGEWKGWRDCHLKPDLVLIYRLEGDELELARVGSHSELFG